VKEFWAKRQNVEKEKKGKEERRGRGSAASTKLVSELTQ